MTERRTLGDLDFDHGLDDLDDDGWYGSALSDAPVKPSDAGELRPADVHTETWDNPEDTDRWYVPADLAEVEAATEAAAGDVPREARREPMDSGWTGVLAPHDGRKVDAPPAESWQTRLSTSGAWDFKASAADPWYRSRKVIVAVGVAVAAIVVAGILLPWRGPGPGSGESPPAAPTPTSAAPAPASSTPALSTAMPPPPPLPPPPPPPPPTSAEQITGPTAPRQYVPSRQSEPSQSDMPEIGVTRTPVTRAPLSATPPPPPAPDRNSSTPGDGRGRGSWAPW